MAEAMSKEQATNILEFDILRRVGVRGMKLFLSGLVGAAGALSFTAWYRDC